MKKMEMIKKKLIPMTLAIALVGSMVPAMPKPAAAADTVGYLCVCPLNSKGYPNSKKITIFASQENNKIKSIKGLSYNKSSNTLTIKNYDRPKKAIVAYAMGKDFKIKVVGKNSVQNITGIAKNSKNRCWMTFKGTGKLVVNKNKRASDGILLNAGNTKCRIKLGSQTKFRVYSKNKSDSYAICLEKSMYSSNGIKYSGTPKNGGKIAKKKWADGSYTFIYNKQVFSLR